MGQSGEPFGHAPTLPVIAARFPTLVRHVYDLHVIREQYDAADVASLAREIMVDDAQTYGRDFPAYEADPLAETLKAIDGIAADADFVKNYARSAAIWCMAMDRISRRHLEH
jgi:hypothetical protein